MDEAIVAYHRALVDDPGHVLSHCGLGVALVERGEAEAGISSYLRALETDPWHADTRFNYSLALLLLGEFEKGWSEYEWRFKQKKYRDEVLRFASPAWDGSSLEGKSILLRGEQGIGDTIQFVRYAKTIADAGGRVIIECQPSMKRLLENISEVDSVIGRGEDIPPCDAHVSLMSLPHVLGTTLETIPDEVPYLSAPEGQTSPGEGDGEGKGIKVGLVWAGNPDHENDRKRSIPLEKFASVLETGGVRFYGLQVGERKEDIERCGFQGRITDLSGELTDFADTAAAIAHLDLIISVDTAPAHLAWAMGRPVWTLLPFAPDWRWMLGREDSPWYPTMRLLRQGSAGDWAGFSIGSKKNYRSGPLVEMRDLGRITWG